MMKVEKMMVVGMALAAMVAQTVCAEDVADAETNAVEAVQGAAKGDPDVERALRERGLKYEIDERGSFVMSFSEASGRRSQMVAIMPETVELEGLKVRKICSCAYRGRLTKPMAMELLRESYKLGYWRIETDAEENRDYVLFTAQVPVSVTPAELESWLQIVAHTADLKEEEWSDVDEL